MSNSTEAYQFVEHFKNIELKRQVFEIDLRADFMFCFVEFDNMYEKIKEKFRR